jgi:hypothetical protein
LITSLAENIFVSVASPTGDSDPGNIYRQCARLCPALVVGKPHHSRDICHAKQAARQFGKAMGDQ